MEFVKLAEDILKDFSRKIKYRRGMDIPILQNFLKILKFSYFTIKICRNAFLFPGENIKVEREREKMRILPRVEVAPQLR